MAVLYLFWNTQMAHRGIRAAVVGRVMALGAELERNLGPDISGSGCSSRCDPGEEAIIR